MKKSLKKVASSKLSLHRETVARLQDLPDEKLERAAGGDVSSCIQPRCGGLEPY